MRPSSPPPALRAFSLIEILMAVLILGLGLLGIGAIFPVVVREQRHSTETTMGVLVAGSARDMLAGTTLVAAGNADFWNTWRSTAPNTTGQPERGGIPFESPTATPKVPRGNWFIPHVDPDTGELYLGVDDLSVNPPYLRRISVRERLFPLDAGIGVQPQFVWDIAIQRIPDADTSPPPNNHLHPTNTNDALRIALFVRRIDPRLRVAAGNLPGVNPPRRLSLLDVLTNTSGSVVPTDLRVPVGSDPVDDRPTYDGLGDGVDRNYSKPLTLRVAFNYDPSNNGPSQLYRRDRLYPAASPAYSTTERAHWQLLRQVNQRIVDNLGNQYTVVELGTNDNGEEYIRISPEVPSYITESMSSLPGLSNGGAGEQIKQVVFTPQVPAAVVLWTVKP